MLSDARLHYLDNAATTMVDGAVAEAIHRALLSLWANPSSLYDPAVTAQQAMQQARARVAKTLNCREDELYFTSCGSESNNLALQGAAIPRAGWGNKIVVTGFEHPSVQLPLRALKARGFDVLEIAPEKDGSLNTAKFLAAVDKNTVLAACMAVNNETGAGQDLAALAAGIKKINSRCHFHVDGVQAWLRIPLDMKVLAGVDSLSVSGHKVHAPKGVGALFLRDRMRQTLQPPYLGGHQERGIRPGTENIPYLVGLGVAAQQGHKTMRARTVKMRALNDQLREGLAAFPGFVLNSPAGAVAEVLNFSTCCINSQTFINYLNDRQIYLSGGSACDKGEPSHTLQAMGADERTVRTALRVSFCADNTPEDVQALLAGLRDGLAELQHI